MNPANTDAVPQPTELPLPNPLHALHEAADAEFQPYADLRIVSTFGEPQAEYAAIRKACALMDLPQRGVLELTGRDRLPFLNNLLTNQLWDKASKSGLGAGRGVYAFFLNLKGRIVADVNVLDLGDRTLLEMDARLVATLLKTLDRYLFVDQVKMADKVGALHALALHGPGAPAVLDAAVASHVVELPPLGSTTVDLFGVETVVWRDDLCGVPGLHLLVPAGAAMTVWAELTSRFGELIAHARRPLRPAGWAAFNAARVEAGRALFGIDFDDTILPAETGLFDRAVSVTKGCYLGQEIVARMHARKQVARLIVGLRVEGDFLPVAGTPVYDAAQNAVGGITSSTISPVLSGAAVCLALVKKPFFGDGTTLHVPAEGAVRTATVVKTPFLKSE